MDADKPKRSRSLNADMQKLISRRDRSKQETRELNARITALASRAEKRNRGPETRDKLLIGVAALTAARTNPVVKVSIDIAIRSLNERERAHLGRDGSLWLQTDTKIPSDAQCESVPAILEQPSQSDLVAVDDPDLALISFKPDEKRLWRWYDHWDDHGSLFSAMRMERNNFGYWLAKTYMQEKALALLGRHPEPRFDGMNREEAEQFIVAMCERDSIEPDSTPRAPQELMTAFLKQQEGKTRSRKRSP